MPASAWQVIIGAITGEGGILFYISKAIADAAMGGDGGDLTFTSPTKFIATWSCWQAVLLLLYLHSGSLTGDVCRLFARDQTLRHLPCRRSIQVTLSSNHRVCDHRCPPHLTSSPVIRFHLSPHATSWNLTAPHAWSPPPILPSCSHSYMEPQF